MQVAKIKCWLKVKKEILEPMTKARDIILSNPPKEKK